MKRSASPSQSLWSLRLDLFFARVLVWLLSVGREVELAPEAHAWLCVRYHRLADHYRLRGRVRAARRAEARADEHCDNDGPPYAAAMAMPRPKRFFVTNAVGKPSRQPPDDAA